MNEWFEHFNAAAEAYTKALHSGATVSRAERATSAKVFRARIADFKSGGEQAVAIVKSEMHNEDFHRASAAARLFIECGDENSLAELAQNVTSLRNKAISRQDLKRLWIKIPPSVAFYYAASHPPTYEQPPLLDAILYRPIAAAYKLFAEICAGTSYGEIAQAISAVAKWGDMSLLQHLMNTYVVDDALIASWYGLDVRSDAAFYLGLNGDQSGIEFLKRIANSANFMQAVGACSHLAQLALPDAIEPTMKLLANSDGDVVARAIIIAADLGLPAFIPALCNVAERKQASAMYDSETPLYDEAIRAIREIIGKPIEKLPEEYLETGDFAEGEYSDGYRRKAIAVAQSVMKSLNPIHRYYRGELLTLNHLASDLLSPHFGPMFRAANNLWAITGENYGFDPGDDIIANMSAIEKWQQRASRPEPLISGGWAFQGESLPDPKLN